MNAAREAFFLPLAFLTVALLGGLQPDAATPFAPPPLFALVLAVLIMAALIRTGTLVPPYLLHASRGRLANANGACVMLTLFAASAQLFNLLTPRTGLPLVIVSSFLFVLLLNTLVAAPDRTRMLRSLLVICGAAFVLKFVILDALADPAGGRTKRVLVALLDVATLGTVSQEPLPPIAGYIAFSTVSLYLIAVALLPRDTRLSNPAWPVRIERDGQEPMQRRSRNSANP
jgi:hypothetical protein